MLKRMSRRELGQMAAAVTTAAALPVGAQETASEYIGPLTGITAGLEDRRFDPVAYAKER